MESTSVPQKVRGPNKGQPWARDPEGPVAVLRLALDASDAAQRARVEQMFSAAFSLRRALQRDVRSRIEALLAAPLERARAGAAAARDRLGLSRVALEHQAYEHLDRAPHLRRHLTKALAMHMADSVWTPAERFLFPDVRGHRQGKPGVGRWFDFSRIPGRARSHTTDRKWETFRLHGTLDGHRAAYRGRNAAFFQPRRMRRVDCSGDSWWTHDGPLAVVFTGLPGGTLVLPVRLPASPSNQPILDEYLSKPELWHKIDLVRRRDPGAEGGWKYEAHLMVLAAPYVSPSTRQRRALAASETAGRRAGIDVNVSNVTVASHLGGADLKISRIARNAEQTRRIEKRRERERRRERTLERSRRAANPDQYHLSSRQERRAREREARGLPAQKVNPRGPRKSRADGKPQRSYRKDTLSKSYRRERAAQAADAGSSAQAKRNDARSAAGRIVAEHGFRLTVEDCNLAAWAPLWGRSMSAFSPGILLSSIEREAAAVAAHAAAAGGVFRASPQTTALSQHCLCGSRVRKTLADRVHRCPTCGLTGDRDAVSAALAAHVTFDGLSRPASARVDFASARVSLTPVAREILLRTLEFAASGRQDARSESTPSTAFGASAGGTGRTPQHVVVARRIAEERLHPTPDEIGALGRTTSDRAQTRFSMIPGGDLRTPLRGIS